MPLQCGLRRSGRACCVAVRGARLLRTRQMLPAPLRIPGTRLHRAITIILHYIDLRSLEHLQGSCGDYADAICARVSRTLATRPRSACVSKPRAGSMAATAMEFASAAPRNPASEPCCRLLTVCARFANEALKPHAAKEGIATWSSASKPPRCSPAAASNAACCLAAAATRGSNSGTATLSAKRGSTVLRHFQQKSTNSTCT